MTPLQITMMLHYYAIAEPYALRQPEHADSPAVREQRIVLIGDDLLTREHDDVRGYRVTERGQAYIDALMAMPLPVCKWTIPPQVTETGEPIGWINQLNPWPH
jgi:hypothetical protein